ncbi:HDOD domain-containing protein, partial [Streptococcus pseudopneumoniae]|uniref:HDOD domain-containing protein n=1 Tax=Streptococcus pseudopneumoniae TaxID=257758 RepID=UPI00110C3A51
MRQDIRSFVERLDQLPTLSPLAIQLIDSASQPDVGIRDIARLISSDQSLASRLLKIANSVAFGLREVRTLEH